MTRPAQSKRSVAGTLAAGGLDHGGSRLPVILRFLRDGVEGLSPASFSLVMATGIVSIASALMGFDGIAYCLFVLNAGLVVLLSVLNISRGVFFPRRVQRDLCSAAASPGYFTIVAGLCVFGQQLIMIAGYAKMAGWLWIGALFVWLVVTYTVFASIILAPEKPGLKNGLSGVWLISTVAMQAISVLGTSVAAQFLPYREIVVFTSLAFFLAGSMLYVILITLIFFRLTFMSLEIPEITPPYWINMGATAITTQAGAALILYGNQSQGLADIVPFLKGFTLFFWSAGTWWIPLLVILGVWVHLVRRVPIRYSPQLWAMVFPIGMYTASTCQLAAATGFEFLLAIPELTVFLALFLWTVTFAGLLHEIGKGLLSREVPIAAED